jgi:putative spermidine/putrescine transport system ATP-binding protein
MSITMSNPALRVRDLEVTFGDHPGLAGVAFSVGAGERFAIVGPSGAGKTTILRALAGLTPIVGGQVEIAGRDVTSLAPERRDAVYLHQAPVLFPHLSVFENIAFPLRVRRLRSGEVSARVAEMLSIVRLDDCAARAPRTLSGGQRHRVALARAMAARPALLLLDEPLSSIDPTLRDEVRRAILDLQEAYRPGLVLVTHDFDEAGVVADRVAVLLDRSLGAPAPPDELFARPPSLAVARFLGFPNEIGGQLSGDGMFTSPLGCFGPLRGARAGPAVAVCRAEAIRVGEGEGGVAVRVVSIRHRAQWTTAIGEVPGASPPLRLEFQVRSATSPITGSTVRVRLDPLAVSLFAV